MRRRTIHTVILCAALLAVLPATQARAAMFDLETKITASGAAAGDEFGESVSIAGDTAIVGARQNDDAGSNSGSAYIFGRNQGELPGSILDTRRQDAQYPV